MTSENRERAAARSADIRAEPRLRPVIYSAKLCYVSLRSIRMRTPLRHSRTPLALPAPRAARPIGPSRGVPHTFAGRRAARAKGRAEILAAQGHEPPDIQTRRIYPHQCSPITTTGAKTINRPRNRGKATPCLRADSTPGHGVRPLPRRGW